MRAVANDAALAHRFVLEDKGAGLVAMTRAAAFALTRHGQSPRGLADVISMGIVALDAVHSLFHHGMMLGQMKLGLRLQVALEATLGVLARIKNVSAPASPGFHVLAAGPMAGLAPGLAGHLAIRHVHTGVGARQKLTADIGVTLQTRMVAHIARPGNFWRRHYSPIQAGAREQEQRARRRKRNPRRGPAGLPHRTPPAENANRIRASTQADKPPFTNLRVGDCTSGGYDIKGCIQQPLHPRVWREPPPPSRNGFARAQCRSAWRARMRRYR